MHRRLALLAWLFVLAACARVPPPLQGTYPDLSVAQAQAQAQGVTGERVRWGGEIVNTTPQSGETCFEVVSQPLDRRMRPVPTDDTSGRFIACEPGFADPAIYAPKREITVVGALEQPTTAKVGEYDYSFPKVRADTVYLWPKREPRDLGYPYAYGGYPWGWGFGWGWGWGSPYWGGRYWGGGPYFIGRTVRPGRPR